MKKRIFAVLLSLVTVACLAACSGGSKPSGGVMGSQVDETAQGMRMFEFEDVLVAEIPAAWGERTEDEGAVGVYNAEENATRGMLFVRFDAQGLTAAEWTEKIVVNEEKCGEIGSAVIGSEEGSNIECSTFKARTEKKQKNEETGEEEVVSAENWCYYLFENEGEIITIGILNTQSDDMSEYDDILATVKLKAPEAGMTDTDDGEAAAQ